MDPCDYAFAFQQTARCTWKCLVGNLKKWKGGRLQQTVFVGGETLVLTAERMASAGETHEVAFSWEPSACTFADILDVAGALPIPPYLQRDTEESDLAAY